MQSTVCSSKSPLTLLVLIAVMVVATLVVISNYFLRPGMELDLTHRITKNFLSYGINSAIINVSGRDVTLTGSVLNYTDAKNIEKLIQETQGIRQVENKLVIKNQTTE